MIYDIALAIVLYIFYEKLIKTLVAFEFKVKFINFQARFDNKEDPEFFDMIKQEDPTSYLFFIKHKDANDDHFKELTFAMALRKIYRSKIFNCIG